MESSSSPINCTFQGCTAMDQLLVDPCNEKGYYNCKTWRPCAPGTNFIKSPNKTCQHNSQTSEKEKFWDACNKQKQPSLEECRKIWPEDGNKWNLTKIKEFLEKQSSTMPTSPQQINLLVPFVTVCLFLICFLVVIFVFLLKRRKRLQRKKENDALPENKDEDSFYEEINENQMMASIPAPDVAVPKINKTLDPSTNAYFNQVSYSNTSNQEEAEGEYNVLDFVGIQQNFKSNDMLPDGYSSCKFDCAENQMMASIPAADVAVPKINKTLDPSTNAYFNHVSYSNSSNQEEAEAEYNVLDFVGIQQNFKSNEMLPDGYSSCKFDCAENQMMASIPAPDVAVPKINKTLDPSTNAYFNQVSYSNSSNQEEAEAEYNVLDFVGIQQNFKSNEMLPDGYSSCKFDCAENSYESSSGIYNMPHEI